MKTINKILMPLLMLFCFCCGISPFASGQGGLATYSTAGAATFTVPPGVANFTIKLWGAGGGGGATPGTDGQGGGGGGAFQLLNVDRTAFPPLALYNLVIGAGGTAGNAGGNTTAGGTFIASGGAGSNTGNGFGGFGGIGVAQTFSDVTSSFAWNGGNGGASANPQQTSFGGGGGGRGDNGANGGNGVNGGTSGSGAPGAGGVIGGGIGGNTGGSGANATSYGGGGGGRGFNGVTSGTGGDGRIEFSWICPTLTSITYPATTCNYAFALNPTILPATALGGTFSSPTLGAFLNTSTGVIATGAPQGTHVITYGWVANGGCPAASVQFTLVIQPQAVVTSLTYAGTPYCTNLTNAPPTLVATGAAGTYSYSGVSGNVLSINAGTGVINPSLSTPGNYTVKYEVAATGQCLAVIRTTNVTITQLPTITNFDYPPAGTPNKYCKSAGPQTPLTTISNPNNNVISYTSSPSGLTLDGTSGIITPTTSTVGVYTVTMQIAAGGGCAAVTATSQVEILALPTATFNYAGSPYCQTVGSTPQLVNISATTGGAFTAPNFSATPSGLTIDATSGTINLNSAPNTYTVTYAFTGANGCTNTATTTVVINRRPTATISYSGPSSVCSNASPTVSGNVLATGPWTLTLSNGQTATGTGNGTWSININTLNPGDLLVNISVASLVDANCSAVANPDLPGSVTISKYTITSGDIPGASNVKVCEGQAANINVVLTSMAGCAPNPRFSGVFAIEYWDGVNYIPHPTNPTYAWTSNAGASTSGVNTSISIPAAILNNPNSYTLQYRISWVSLVDCRGCAADPLTGSVIVEVVPNPILLITAAPTADVCPGTVVPFTLTQDPNSYVQPQFALFNWVATATPLVGTPFIIGQGQNVSLGTINVTTPSCPFNGTISVRFTPINASCCNCLYAPITRTFVVRDITAPVLSGTLPPNQLNLNLCFSAIPTPPTAATIAGLYTDNCNGPVTATRTGAPTGNNCTWSAVYTYVMSDQCGNTTTAIITYTGGDRTPPALTGTIPPSQINLNLCLSAIPVGPTAADIAALYTDNCSGNTVTASKTGVTTGSNCAWSVTYTYIVSDNCGNTTSATVSYSGGDKTAPALSGNNTIPAGQTNINDCLANAPVGPTASFIAGLYIDNCTGNTVSATKSATTTGTNCGWTVVYTYIISDNCGNTTSATITYTGSDRTAPVLSGNNTVPQGQSNINNCQANAPVGPTALAIAALYTDNCSGNSVTATKTATTSGNNCAWSVTYTYVISDLCANTTTATITYSGGDRTAPVLSGNNTIPQGQTNVNDCLSNVNPGPTAIAIAALYIDNCSGNSVTATKATTTTGNNCTWSVTYTYTISDLCANTTTATITYSGGDRTAPVLSGSNVFPANVTNVNSCIGTANLPVDPSLVPTNAAIAALYVDNCSGNSVTVTRTVGSLRIESTNCNWLYNYTYTISDLCGNTTTRAFTVSGGDKTPPVITNVIPTQVLNTGAGANCGIMMPDYTTLVVATDCTNNITLTQLAPNAPGTWVYGFNGTRVVTIMATDACGNTSTTTFNVDLKDLTPPEAICKPFTVILSGTTGTGVITVPNINNGSFDNCTPTSQLIYSLSQTNFTCANVGANTVTLTVTDQCGNSSTCSSIVTVIDNTKPVITCFGDTTINKDANCTYTMPNLTFRATVSDICGTPVVTQSPYVGSIFGASVQSVVVTLTATDASGNTSTCNFTINFKDVTPPVFANCPSNIIVRTGLGATGCTQTATWTPPTATDACIVCCLTQPVTSTHQPGATFNLGVTTVTYTAVDASGNTNTCFFTVTVLDDTRPIIANCPSNVTFSTAANATTCATTATWTAPTFTDNCVSGALSGLAFTTAPTVGLTNGGQFPVGITTVTYIATDASGNTSTPCVFTVTVRDVTKPTLTCPGNITSVPNANGCLASIANPNPTYSDNCAVASVSWTMTGVGTNPAGTSSASTGFNFIGTRSFNVGVTTITYLATDVNGNTQTCSYTVTVNKPLSGIIAVGNPASSAVTVMQNVSNTSTVSFTINGGVAPYTIVYTAPAGGFGTSGNAPGNNTIVTSTTGIINSSTIGGNPNNLITTVAQSNATPGVYAYTLVSVTDALGCSITPGTTATVTVLAANSFAPDLAPVVSSPVNTNFSGAQAKNGYLTIDNITPNPTTGKYKFRVFVPTNFDLEILGTTTMIGGTPVNNTDFDITVSGSGIFIDVESKTGVVLGASSNAKLGFKLTANGGSGNRGILSVSVFGSTGGIIPGVGDSNSANNQTSTIFLIN